MKKICKGCKLEKGIEEFNYKDKKNFIRQSQCKSCTRLQVRKHYYIRRDYYLGKAQKRNKLIKEAIKKYIWKYLQENPCVDCGETDIVVLTFDHVKGKLFNISESIRWKFGIEMVKKEIAKCEIRCANCHLRKTAKQFGWKK